MLLALLVAVAFALTGFKDAPDSFPASMSKYVGAKVGSKGQDQQEIRRMAGAPELVVEEVNEMKITLKPAMCSGRPDTPNSLSDPWPGMPADCPWWYTRAVMHDGPVKWAVDCERGFCKDEATLCESGTCYHLDFHIDLGGLTEADRTLFGNPENDAATGLERGVFFLYDPTVDSNGKESFFEKYFMAIMIAAGTLVFLLIVFSCFCCCKKICCKKRCAGKGKGEEPMKPVGVADGYL